MCLRRRPTGEVEGDCGIIVRAGPPCLILTYRRRQEAWNTSRRCAAFVFMNNAHRASRSVWKTATRNVELGFFLARMRPFGLISCFSASVSFLFPPLLRATFANLSLLNINFPFEAFPLPRWFPTQGGLGGAVPGCPATRAPQRAYPALQESGARDRRRARSAPSAPASVRSPPCPRRPFAAALTPRPLGRRGRAGPRCPPPLSPAPESRRSALRGAEAAKEGGTLGKGVKDSAPGCSLLGAPFWGARRGGPDSALPQPLGRYLQLPLPAQIPSEGGHPISRGSGTGRAAPPRPHSSRQGEALRGRTPSPRPQLASLENPNNDFPTAFRTRPCARPTSACAPAPRAPPARAAPAGTPLLPGAGDARSHGGGPRERSRAAAGRWSRLRPHLSKLAGG